MLGCRGGPFEGDLSGYVLVDVEKKECILLDAGTLLHGLHIAYEKGALSDFSLEDPELSPVGAFFTHHIKGYLISHPHLDHILGLVIASQVDIKKPILGLDVTIDALRDHVFNGKIWVDHGSENAPSLYTYVRLQLGRVASIPGTRMRVEPFFLTHSKTLSSTAFLIECEGDYILYFGDTSSDFVEGEKNMEIIWKRIAPLVVQGKIKALFLECSFSNVEDKLYGHLTPHLFFKELGHLALIAQVSLKGLKVIVTHRKGTLGRKDDLREKIASDLIQENTLGVEMIFPEQGARFTISD